MYIPIFFFLIGLGERSFTILLGKGYLREMGEVEKRDLIIKSYS